MNEVKQHIFIQRVLFVHSVLKGKAGKAQVLRLTPSVWDQEADISCVAGSVLEKMQSFRDPQNLLVFQPDTVKAAMTRFIEGILGSKLTQKSHNFKIEHKILKYIKTIL